MKFSELWLREWVNVNVDSQTLTEQITMLGLEVDNVEPVAGYFAGVIIGHIIKYEHLCKNKEFFLITLDINSKYLINIISKYSKCRIGSHVAVAPVGAILYKNFKVKKIKIYDKLSEGMLCSFADLGIFNNKNNDIIELPFDSPIGLDVREYLKLNDNTINVNITPNRSDCLNLLGIARDIAVRNRIIFKPPITFPVIPVTPVISDTVAVSIQVPNYCQRYLYRVINNININVKTPIWMTEKLRRCGIHLENVITDIINYVLLELGQPICVFDKKNIHGNITVRLAKNNEEITVLNNKLISLTNDTLITSDNTKIIAITGIIPSMAVNINHSTNNIILECVHFCPSVINSYAYKYNLNSNIAYRHDHGVDPAIQDQAMERVTFLLVSICGGSVGPIVDINTLNTLTETLVITLYRKNLDRIIGYYIQDYDVIDILTRLGCKVQNITNIGWNIIPPTWRFDITIEEDLIEEIIRMHGYDCIPSIPIYTNINIPIHTKKSKLSLMRVKTLLVDRGYQEVITYSFVNPNIQLLLHPDQIALKLQNPISQDMSVMRVSLWTGLISTVIYNQNRQHKRIRLFESGLCFFSDPTENKLLKIRQDFMFAGIITGTRFTEHWDSPVNQVDFYDIKGDLESIFETCGKLHDIEFKPRYNPALHPGQSAAIYLQNKCVGYIGLIHPEIEFKLNLHSHVLVFEFVWKQISSLNLIVANDIIKYPITRRDIALIIKDNILSADIIKECKKIIGHNLENINILDVYKGKGIASGFKSITISISLKNDTHTLKEKEIKFIISKCIKALNKCFQAILRN